MYHANPQGSRGGGRLQFLTLSLILALWQNWRKALELTSISPRVAEDRCAMTLGFRLQSPLLKVVRAEPACAQPLLSLPAGHC